MPNRPLRGTRGRILASTVAPWPGCSPPEPGPQAPGFEFPGVGNISPEFSRTSWGLPRLLYAGAGILRYANVHRRHIYQDADGMRARLADAERGWIYLRCGCRDVRSSILCLYRSVWAGLHDFGHGWVAVDQGSRGKYSHGDADWNQFDEWPVGSVCTELIRADHANHRHARQCVPLQLRCERQSGECGVSGPEESRDLQPRSDA